MTRDHRTFYEVLSAAIADLTTFGYDSAERLERWTRELRQAAEATMASEWRVQQMMRDALGAVYRRLVDHAGLLRVHPGVSRFTIERLRPMMRVELDKRILASANLIKLNRVETIEKTLRRFQGWATSIPVGGTRATDRRETKDDVKKALASLPFIERRVLIDQGHKLRASISEVVARDGGAIALIWRSHWREANYNYRVDHKERDGLVYAVRGNWALERGLMKVGPAGYYDDITAVGEEPFCRCYATWIYSIGSLPEDMVTKLGAEELRRVRAA